MGTGLSPLGHSIGSRPGNRTLLFYVRIVIPKLRLGEIEKDNGADGGTRTHNVSNVGNFKSPAAHHYATSANNYVTFLTRPAYPEPTCFRDYPVWCPVVYYLRTMHIILHG